MILLQLLVILLLTRTFGEGAVRLGQPAAIGEILAGVLMAAAALLPGPQAPFMRMVINGEVFHHAATAGIFFLMLLAGIELKPRELTEKSYASFAVALDLRGWPWSNTGRFGRERPQSTKTSI
jgi:Kef-type K+ transport system membrane component KefB